MTDLKEPEAIHRALEWLTGLFTRHKVPYLVVGGLAAQAYGATRPLVDVDVYIPFYQAGPLLEEIRPFIVRPPGPHLSASWDLVYLALEYEGIYIEIGDSSTPVRYYNRRDERWEDQVIHYDDSVFVRLYGVDLAVMPRTELTAYKAQLDREVDHLDIAEMNSILG